jgi:hypothetical protein
MKVSIDGILGSARKINSQRNSFEEEPDKKAKEVKTDSLSITKRLDTRNDTIETEFRTLQNSLTKNQIVRQGLEQLTADINAGGKNVQDIIESVKFEGTPVLKELSAEKVTKEKVAEKTSDNNEKISSDINSIKKLQVEADNIMASNLTDGGKAETLTKNIGSIFNNATAGSLDGITNLQADKVMRLIK